MKTEYITTENCDSDHSYAFQKEPFTIIHNNVIQKSTHTQATFFWIYLKSLPPNWKIRRGHITKHFNISDRTYDRWLAYLNRVNLVEYRRKRYPNGTFGKCEVYVLDGSNFAPEADVNHTAKFGGVVVTSIDSAQSAHDHHSAKNPHCGESTPVGFGAYINKTKIFKKDIDKEINKTGEPSIPVSVFSDSLSVKTHILATIRNRGTEVAESIVDEIVYYVDDERNYDAVVKKTNIALKKVREGAWNTPHGYKGITSKTIREKEEMGNSKKIEQYQQEASAFQRLLKTQLISESSSSEQPSNQDSVSSLLEVPFTESHLELIARYRHAAKYGQIETHFPNTAERNIAFQLWEKAQSMNNKREIKRPMQRLGDILSKKSA